MSIDATTKIFINSMQSLFQAATVLFESWKESYGIVYPNPKKVNDLKTQYEKAVYTNPKKAKHLLEVLDRTQRFTEATASWHLNVANFITSYKQNCGDLPLFGIATEDLDPEIEGICTVHLEVGRSTIGLVEGKITVEVLKAVRAYKACNGNSTSGCAKFGSIATLAIKELGYFLVVEDDTPFPDDRFDLSKAQITCLQSDNPQDCNVDTLKEQLRSKFVDKLPEDIREIYADEAGFFENTMKTMGLDLQATGEL